MTLKLGDRHSRPTEGLGLKAQPKIVLIRAGNVSGWTSGQHLLVCMINLLSRLHGSVSRIFLEVEGNIDVLTPNVADTRDAYEAMASMANWSNGGAIPLCRGEFEADLIVDVSRNPRLGADLYAVGSGWKAWVGSMPPSFFEEDDRTECLGPYFAASLAVGEIFKLSKGLLKGRYAADETYSVWSGVVGQWSKLANGPVVAGACIPPFYLVGAGAVGQGVVQILGASQLHSAYVVTIDHDHHDKEGTNLNRCFLAGVEDVGDFKVNVVSRYRQAAGLEGYEFRGKLTDYVMATKPGLDQMLARREMNDEYWLVFSAVDLNSSRQDIQGLRPDIVVGGSTDGLRAQTNVYGTGAGLECLGCRNVPEGGKLNASVIEAELRTMSLTERRVALTDKVDDIENVLAYLAEPTCGRLGQAEVQSFASSVTPEFSVSFVSMASAVMGTSRLFSRTVFSGQPAHSQTKGIFQFKNLMAFETNTVRRPDCPHCGDLAR